MRSLATITLVLAALAGFGTGVRAQEPVPVVHALLFYSPTCPHCHQVINETLIPLQNRYGNRLVILGFDTTRPALNDIYWAAMEFFHIPEDQWVVPILVVGDQYMVGGIEIPERFPGMIEEGLAGRGIDLPDFPELLTFLGQQNLLDVRFPGRRIAAQTPPVPLAEAGPGPTRAPAAAGAGAPARDTAGADTLVPPAPARADTAGPAGDTAAPAAGAPPPADTGAPAPGARTAPPERGTPPAQGGEAPGEAPGAGAGEAPPAGEGATPRSTPPPPPSAAPGRRDAPVGLGEAARQLESLTMADRFRQDPRGNSLSVVVLLAMLASLVLTGYPPRARGKVWPSWTVPVLVVVGAAVASYLSFVEVADVEAVCGPVGDCNTVNQSEYATLFGFLPVGVLGLMGYAAILVAWVLTRTGSPALRAQATLALWAFALAGTLFSIYLTFLEPFVIGATCIWCLTSAVVMTVLLWATASMAAEVWPGSALRAGPDWTETDAC